MQASFYNSINYNQDENDGHYFDEYFLFPFTSHLWWAEHERPRHVLLQYDPWCWYAPLISWRRQSECRCFHAFIVYAIRFHPPQASFELIPIEPLISPTKFPYTHDGIVAAWNNIGAIVNNTKARNLSEMPTITWPHASRSGLLRNRK